MKEKIILIGGGGHCRSCIDIFNCIGQYDILGIIDMPERVGDELLGHKFIGSDSHLHDFVKPEIKFLVTVGQIKSSSTRQHLFETLISLGADLPTIVSPRAYVSPYATLGAGTVVMHDALINAGANIGKNCIINSKALVEHDAKVGDHCHVSTGAILNGCARLGDHSFLGSGAVCVQGVKISSHSFIKAGSLKTES